jgi:hypothetical protein
MQLSFFGLSYFVVSTVKEIKPVNWEQPRLIGVVYESSAGIIESDVEFDTIEAARDWRNELRGAIPFHFSPSMY